MPIAPKKAPCQDACASSARRIPGAPHPWGFFAPQVGSSGSGSRTRWGRSFFRPSNHAPGIVPCATGPIRSSACCPALRVIAMTCPGGITPEADRRKTLLQDQGLAGQDAEAHIVNDRTRSWRRPREVMSHIVDILSDSCLLCDTCRAKDNLFSPASETCLPSSASVSDWRGCAGRYRLKHWPNGRPFPG